jgi:hypothetical protein
MLPHFLIAGVMKSGTTFLGNLMANHRNVEILERNMDYNFFDNDVVFTRGIDWYESLFEKYSSKDMIIGQISADCAYNNGSIERIQWMIPSIKLIFILRHPIDRAYSMYWHQYSLGREFRSFENAIKREDKIVQKDYYHYKMFSYVNRSKYKAQFKNVYNYFDENQVLLIPFDALIESTLEVMNKIFSFLGVTRINSLNELNIDSVPRNRTRIPSNHMIVYISAILQKIKLIRLGRIIIFLNRKDQRPPEMKKSTRKLLENILKDDIAYYYRVKENFSRLLKY